MSMDSIGYEVKNKRHLEDSLLTPSEWPDPADVVFPIPLRPFPGRPIVIMLADSDKVGETEFQGRKVDIMAPPTYKGALNSRMQPDFGVLVGFQPRRDGQGEIIYDTDKQLHVGRIYAIRPYAGTWFTHLDFDWIPEGRQVKILGKYAARGEDDLSNDIIAEVDPALYGNGGNQPSIRQWTPVELEPEESGEVEPEVVGLEATHA